MNCTKNGCWNCAHGGNLKLLRTLVRSMYFCYGIQLTNKAKKEIQEKIKPDDNRCGIDVRNQVEPGFICEKWTYDGNGYQEE